MMRAPPERSSERDEAITAVLKRVPSAGWTRHALIGALREIGLPADYAAVLFPGGVADMIEVFLDLADRRMEEEAARREIGALRISQRVRAIIALRLEQNRPHKEAIRRAASLLALPANAALAARCTARTVDAMWHAAKDRSADFAWYTKRATLAFVYCATLFYWLGDQSEDDAATLLFLDRRLGDVGRFGKLRGRAEEVFRRWLPPAA